MPVRINLPALSPLKTDKQERLFSNPTYRGGRSYGEFPTDSQHYGSR